MSTVNISCNYNVYRPNDARWIAPYQSSQLMAGLTTTLGNNYQIVLGFDLSSLAGAVINGINLKFYRFSDDQGGTKTWRLEVASTVNSNGTVSPVGGTDSSLSVPISSWITAGLNSTQITALRTNGYIHFWGDYNGSYAAIRPKEYSSGAYAPYLEVDYTNEPDPQPPSVNTPGTLTADSLNITWSAGSDRIYSQGELRYDIMLSVDDGGTWGTLITTGAGATSYNLNVRGYLGQNPGQYFYNNVARIVVRTRTPSFNGTEYTSGWSFTSPFTINYKLPPTPPGFSMNKSEAYEGESIDLHFLRPSQYNSYNADGSSMYLTYVARLLTNFTLGQMSVLFTDEDPDVTVSVPEVTSPKADMQTSAYGYCYDQQGQTSGGSSNISFKVKRFRKPIAVISDIDRGETSADITVLVQDTGYGSTQNNSQIRKVEASFNGGGWAQVTGTWNGLTFTFTQGSLAVGSTYSLSIRVTNKYPIASLGDKTGDVYAGSIPKYKPAVFIHEGGLDANAGYFGDDYGQEAADGCVKVKNNIDVGQTVTTSRIRVTSTGDASLSSTTHGLQVGPDNGGNIIIDQNEIMARSNGAISQLYINNDGGQVNINGQKAWHAGNDGPGSGLDADTCSGYGIGAEAKDISGQDIFTARPTGLYRGQSCTNAIDSNWWYYLYIYASSDWCYVMAFPLNAPYTKPYINAKRGGSWNSWESIT